MKRLANHLRGFAAIVLTMAVLSTSGRSVSYNEAVKIASDFFSSQGIDIAPAAMRRVKAPGLNNDVVCPYYIINTDKSFAVVSGDSRVTPILAYSLDETFDPDDIAPGAQYMLDGYAEYINAVANGTAAAPAPLKINIASPRLLETATWNQNPSPWNDECPEINGSRSPGGCAATAMSIIMRYHNWPQTTGYGSKSYTPAGLGQELSCDFSATDYKISSIPTDGSYSNVPNWTTEQNQAIAKLIYHAGIAANMEYGATGSGTSNHYAVTGIANYFGYTLGGSALKSRFEDVDDYLQLIIDEIDNGYPMLYSGDSARGGHMFVCDGYNTQGQLHFNFGWSGGGNGYFYITPVQPELEFNDGQCAVLGIRPQRTDAVPDLYFLYAVDSCPMSIVDVDKIYRGTPFWVSVKEVYNTADKDVAVCLAIMLCDADGNMRQSLAERTSNSNIYKGNSFITSFSVALPLDYVYTEGDQLCLFYSSDDGATWVPVRSYIDANSGIDISSYFVDELKLNMNMITPAGGECRGLTVNDGYTINNTGNDFKIIANYLCNQSGYMFYGDVGIFLCDENGVMKAQVGQREVENGLRNNYYRDIFVTCNIPADVTLRSGDRLMAFCRYQGEEGWQKVGSAEPDKDYILIPESLCATSQTISFSTMMYAFSSVDDLDFNTVSNFEAYKILYQDREVLLLERIYQLKAGEGALLWGRNLVGGKYTDVAPFMTGAASHTDNMLVGVTIPTAVVNDETDHVKYIFNATDSEVGFYLANGETVDAGKAYLRIPGSPLNAPLRFTLYSTGGTTGIFVVADDSATGSEIYNMQGVKVLRPTNGVYIINGKKVFIKK